MGEKMSNKESLKIVRRGNVTKVGLEDEGGNSKKVESRMQISNEAGTIFV